MDGVMPHYFDARDESQALCEWAKKKLTLSTYVFGDKSANSVDAKLWTKSVFVHELDDGQEYSVDGEAEFSWQELKGTTPKSGDYEVEVKDG